MAAEEIDIITHLLDVEKEASTTVLDAQKRADEKIAAARSQAESEFKAKYSAVVSEIEQKEKDTKSAIEKKHSADIESYKQNLNSSEKDYTSFNALMDKILFSQENDMAMDKSAADSYVYAKASGMLARSVF